VRLRFLVIYSLPLMFALVLPGWGQSSARQDSATTPKSAHTKKKARGPGKEIGKGGEDMGKSAAKGSADLANGSADGVGNLATGHPVGAWPRRARGQANSLKMSVWAPVRESPKSARGLGERSRSSATSLRTRTRRASNGVP
jgi:hypothetical protein